MLTNPVYGGAYALGRRTMRVAIENGRKRVIRSMQRDQQSWRTLIRDHHEGYISWAEFERNQKLIFDNANGKRYMSKGAARAGEALLPGLFRCARCGKKLHVRYGDQSHRYECVGAFTDLAAPRCLKFGGIRIDLAVAREVLERLQPLGVEAAFAAVDALGQQRCEKKNQLLLALENARYEAARAQRQYDAADPDNRLVAGDLERRWNERLIAVRDLEIAVEQATTDAGPALTATDKERLMALGKDLAKAWIAPASARKRARKSSERSSPRSSLTAVDDVLELIIHWQSGDHTRLVVKRNRRGPNRWATDADVIDLTRALARQMPDELIAAVLNRSGQTTAKGNSWTRMRVCALWRQYQIDPYKEGERAEQGEMTLAEAAAALKISQTTIRRLIKERALPAHQACKGAPWIIRTNDVEREDLRWQADARRSRHPPPDQCQQDLLTLSTT